MDTPVRREMSSASLVDGRTRPLRMSQRYPRLMPSSLAVSVRAPCRHSARSNVSGSMSFLRMRKHYAPIGRLSSGKRKYFYSCVTR